MKIIQLLILFVILCFFVYILFILISKIIRKIKAKEMIYNKLSLIGPTKINKSKVYDYEVEYNKTKHLIKVIYNFNNYEITINSKNNWILNDKDVRSKKTGTKLTNIYDLVNDDNSIGNKIYLVYPASRVLMLSVNESELAFIYPTMNCYGVNLVNFDEVQNAIKK